MATKQLTDSEKMALIREHGDRISRAFIGGGTYKDDLIASAQRVVELAKSIPKIEYSVRG